MNEKTVSLCIRCGKVTANLLKAAMVKALAKMEQEKKQQGQRTNQKQPQKEKKDKTYKGKQSMDKLMNRMYSFPVLRSRMEISNRLSV